MPGLGPARRATLLRHFGSVRKIASATGDEIAGLPGFGPKLAEAVLGVLAPGPGTGHGGGTGAGPGPHGEGT